MTAPLSSSVHNEHFDAWDPGDGVVWGRVTTIHDDVGDTDLYAYDQASWRFADDLDATLIRHRAVIDDVGACFGYVQRGWAKVSDRTVDYELRGGQWFVMANGMRLDFAEGGRASVIVAQRLGHAALGAAGGPIESMGRLRYIDGCSDTLLAAPARLGDPCLNLLHFPPGINQTFHVHPSVRAGVVARGAGWCETPHGMSPLEPGLFFSIPANGVHRFLTGDSSMDVIAYHPDSDWGPTDEAHPMLNRTWNPETRTAMEHDAAARVVAGALRGC